MIVFSEIEQIANYLQRKFRGNPCLDKQKLRRDIRSSCSSASALVPYQCNLRSFWVHACRVNYGYEVIAISFHAHCFRVQCFLLNTAFPSFDWREIYRLLKQRCNIFYWSNLLTCKQVVQGTIAKTNMTTTSSSKDQPYKKRRLANAFNILVDFFQIWGH